MAAPIHSDMSCDPNYLMEQSKCFKCIPKGMQREVMISLLCQWANNSGACVPPPFTITGWDVGGSILTVHLGWTDNDPCIDHFVVSWGTAGPGGPFPNSVTVPTGVVCAGPPFSAHDTTADIFGLTLNTTYYFQIQAFSPDPLCDPSPFQYATQATAATAPAGEFLWQPPDRVGDWTDTNGTFSGDLEFFQKNADYATVTDLNLSPKDINLLSGLSALPALQNLDVSSNASLTSLDASNLGGLNNLFCNNCALTFLKVTNDTTLAALYCYQNSGLTSITGIGTCTAMVDLEIDACDITGTLDVSMMTSLNTFSASVNFNLTAVTFTGLTQLGYVDVSNCGLSGAYDFSLNTGLSTLYCNNNSITSLDVTSTSVQTCNCFSNNITGTLNLTGLSSLLYFDCSFNPNLTALTLTGCNSIINFNCANCDLSSLDVTVAAASLSALDCSANINLSTLTVTGCTVLVTLNCVSCDLSGTALDVSTCDSLDSLSCDFNTLSSIDLSAISNMSSLSCGTQATLTSIDIGGSIFWNFVGADLCALTTVSVDNILGTLVGNCLGNAGLCNLSGGTSQPPSTPCIIPASDCDKLITNGWTVFTN